MLVVTLLDAIFVIHELTMALSVQQSHWLAKSGLLQLDKYCWLTLNQVVTTITMQMSILVSLFVISWCSNSFIQSIL